MTLSVNNTNLMGARASQVEPVLIGVSRAIRKVVEMVDTLAKSDCYVLIEGESGTGKELVARRLHAKSRRRDKPFIPFNCAGITETLFESQFFGHVRGAFTGAEQALLGLVRSADGGSLFMDEVGEFPPAIQPKLLRVLEEGEVMPVGTASPVRVNTRFIAATNRNLRNEVREGRFRRDLFYRLNVARICLPPLREHPEDVSVLLDHFLIKFAARYHVRPIYVSKDVRCQLSAYSWPGNVRELASWVERLYATGLEPPTLAVSLLLESDGPAIESQGQVMSLCEYERRAISLAMGQAGNNRKKAAGLLQIHRNTLARKLKEHDLV